MDDLVTWLRAQLDEDELVARAVEDKSAPWDGQWQNDGDQALRTHNGWVLAYPHEGRSTAPGLIEHIARHDPARVLAEVAAKRAIVDEVFRYEAKIDGEWGCCHGPSQIEAGLCRASQPDQIEALRHLAAVYADRPGYREEWRPSG